MNEIFKGMDNASEAIDENFQSGSIVDSGSNENGYYVRYGDGTQICHIPNINIPTTAGTWNVKEQSFPINFINEDISVMPNTNRGGWRMFLNINDITKTSFRIQSDTLDGNTNSMTCSVIAFGRWK